jgi:hypothetical protein
MAVSNYAKSPTLDNGIALSREFAKNRREMLVMRLETGGILCLFMHLAWPLIAFRGDVSTPHPAS